MVLLRILKKKLSLSIEILANLIIHGELLLFDFDIDFETFNTNPRGEA